MIYLPLSINIFLRKGGEKKMNNDYSINDLFAQHNQMKSPKKRYEASIIKENDKVNHGRDYSLSKDNKRIKDRDFNETFQTMVNTDREKQGWKEMQEENDISTPGSGEQRIAKRAEVEKAVIQENIQANESVKVMVEDKGDSKIPLSQAITIIQDSLRSLSQSLGLNLTMELDDLSDFTVDVSSDYVIAQFAEILSSLKGITDLLEKAVQDNVSLVLKDTVFEPQKASLLAQSVRVETFNLEIALNMLGIAGEVNRAVAEERPTPIKDFGIPQALDPKLLAIPNEQAKKIFAAQTTGNDAKLDTIIAKMAALVKEQEVKQGKESAFKNMGLQVLKTETNNENVKQFLDTTPVNPKILRKLLKVDEFAGKPEAQKGESGNGAKGKSISPLFQGATPFKFGAINTVQPLPAAMGETGEQFPGTESLTKLTGLTGQLSEFSVKLPTNGVKTLEESVMLQVTQRMNQAVRSGIYEIRLALRPETLGDMRITIHLEGDVVMARINVENQQVKQIIESNLQHLKDSLEEQNLHAGSFDVNVSHHQEKQEGTNDSEASGNLSHDGSGEQKNKLDQDGSQWGRDTGRRYGLNSFEYLA